MINSILGILGSVLGVLAVWFILKMLRPWIQAWQNKKDSEKIGDALAGQKPNPVNDPESVWDDLRKD